MSTSEWKRFFIEANIPAKVAEQYAVTFHNNRMNFEMLADLNKVKNVKCQILEQKHL